MRWRRKARKRKREKQDKNGTGRGEWRREEGMGKERERWNTGMRDREMGEQQIERGGKMSVEEMEKDERGGGEGAMEEE